MLSWHSLNITLRSGARHRKADRPLQRMVRDHAGTQDKAFLVSKINASSCPDCQSFRSCRFSAILTAIFPTSMAAAADRPISGPPNSPATSPAPADAWIALASSNKDSEDKVVLNPNFFVTLSYSSSLCERSSSM